MHLRTGVRFPPPPLSSRDVPVRRGSLCGADGEEPPAAPDPLQLVLPALGKRCTPSEHQVTHRAHRLLAYREMLAHDARASATARVRADELPLGADALAGAGFPLDRKFVARQLGFASSRAQPGRTAREAGR